MPPLACLGAWLSSHRALANSLNGDARNKRLPQRDTMKFRAHYKLSAATPNSAVPNSRCVKLTARPRTTMAPEPPAGPSIGFCQQARSSIRSSQANSTASLTRSTLSTSTCCNGCKNWITKRQISAGNSRNRPETPAITMSPLGRNWPRLLRTSPAWPPTKIARPSQLRSTGWLPSSHKQPRASHLVQTRHRLAPRRPPSQLCPHTCHTIQRRLAALAPFSSVKTCAPAYHLIGSENPRTLADQSASLSKAAPLTPFALFAFSPLVFYNSHEQSPHPTPSRTCPQTRWPYYTHIVPTSYTNSRACAELSWAIVRIMSDAERQAAEAAAKARNDAPPALPVTPPVVPTGDNRSVPVPPTPPPTGSDSSAGQGPGSNVRPPQTPTNVSTNPLMPTFEELGDVATFSNSIATQQTVRDVLAMAQAQYPGVTAKDLITLAMSCYHNGASKYVTLEGSSPAGVPFSTLKDIVEQHCTLRQFCSYYAKYCYVLGKKTHTPPANWNRRGFMQEAQYAAFDFFNAVLSDAAPNPPGGMAFHPTPAEIKGHSLNAKMAIVESRQQENQHSNRGNLAAMQQVNAAPTAPLITFPS
ncbi:coat protein [Rehmannia allexivirus]